MAMQAVVFYNYSSRPYSHTKTSQPLKKGLHFELFTLRMIYTIIKSFVPQFQTIKQAQKLTRSLPPVYFVKAGVLFDDVIGTKILLPCLKNSLDVPEQNIQLRAAADPLNKACSTGRAGVSKNILHCYVIKMYVWICTIGKELHILSPATNFRHPALLKSQGHLGIHTLTANASF